MARPGSGRVGELGGLLGDPRHDRASGGVVTYVPGLATLDDGVLERFAASDLVLVDGVET